MKYNRYYRIYPQGPHSVLRHQGWSHFLCGWQKNCLKKRGGNKMGPKKIGSSSEICKSIVSWILFYFVHCRLWLLYRRSAFKQWSWSFKESRETDWNEGKADFSFSFFSVKGKSRGLVRSVGLFGLKHKEKYYVSCLQTWKRRGSIKVNTYKRRAA